MSVLRERLLENCAMRTKTPAILRVASTIAVIALCVGAASPSALAAPKEPPARRLALKNVEGLTNGRIAYVVGKTTADEQRFFASGLLVTQPVLVTLKADRPGDEIRLRVTKSQWSQAEREISTGTSDRVQVAFRTQGEFGVAVSGANGGTPYRMTVWIGDEVKRPMESVVVPKSEWKGTARAAPESPGSAAPTVVDAATAEAPAGGGSMALWLIAGALVVIAGLLFALLRRKREH